MFSMNDLKKPLVAVVYLAFHSDEYLDDFIFSVKNYSYPRERLVIIFVDNLHPEFGSGAEVIEDKMKKFKENNDFPQFVILPQDSNLGFSAGNNVGIKSALTLGAEYIIFHNDDGYFAPEGVQVLVDTMLSDPQIAFAQSLILLERQPNLINTSGNLFHYLGFGMCDNYKVPLTSMRQDGLVDIPYVSGAAMIVSRETIEYLGVWDENYFMYHEDMDWSLRAKLLERKVVVAYQSIFYHKYNFSRSVSKFYFMERNRFAILLVYYKLPTLILILPPLILLEFGMLIFSVRHGGVNTRLAVYKYWLRPSSWRLWLIKRGEIQRSRLIKDKELLDISTGKIIFQEESMQNPVLTYIGNPIMNSYLKILKFIVWW